MINNYDKLKTEGRNPASVDIHKKSTLEMLQIMNDENKRVEEAIDLELPNIALAVEAAAKAIADGGHVIYVGCGTSGRLGVIDASECPPTFGVDHSLFRGIIAGGMGAMFKAVEGAEDSEEWGASSIVEDGVTEKDFVIGLSASGRAPFVIGALKKARELGAATASISCNPGSDMEAYSDINIAPYVGPEVVSGSTRLKAGTAQKLILNMISTGAMIKNGKVRGNLMINVRPTNEKLRERAARIICELAEVERDEALRLIDEHGDIPKALEALGIE